jgi:tetratricopeptide (TPR) repeat protein
MIDDYGDKRSMVIPKWLPFKEVSQGAELEIPRKKPFIIDQFTKRQFEEDYLDFKDSPSSFKASDLMGSALVIGKLQIAKEMAEYILKKSETQRPSLVLARKILNLKKGESKKGQINYEISKSKIYLSNYPHNSTGWVDLARLYTIKGQKEKANRAITIALNLAPLDRFVVRSSIRFFIHIGEFDMAWHYARRATQNSNDPMIKSLEVSLADRTKKNIARSKRYVPKNLSYDELFHFSELIESYGMLELNSGNSNRAKKNFKQAWINPTENVITHSEWVLRNRLPTLKESAKLNFSKSHEALSWLNFFDLKLDEALEKSKEWELEEPYSASPYILVSHIYSHIGKHSRAIRNAKEGLLTNPNNFMLKNNLCYALINNGELEEGEKVLNSINPKELGNEILFYHATKGLLEFKKGSIEIGRDFYLKTLKKCKEIKEDRLKTQALLNLAIAEVQAKTEESIKFAESILAESENEEHPSTILLRDRLIKLSRKKRRFKNLIGRNR